MEAISFIGPCALPAYLSVGSRKCL